MSNLYWTVRKTHVTETIVKQVSLNFLVYNKNFTRIRQDITECGLCETPFIDEQQMHIAFTTNTVNKLICDHCASLAKENGVVITDRKASVPDAN